VLLISAVAQPVFDRHQLGTFGEQVGAQGVLEHMGWRRCSGPAVVLLAQHVDHPAPGIGAQRFPGRKHWAGRVAADGSPGGEGLMPSRRAGIPRRATP